MNKVKKVVTSLGVFFTGIISKVFAANLDATIVPRPMAKYGVYEPTLGEKISSAGKIVIPILIFLIGLGVILSKKITKKVKAVILSGLVILGVALYFVMNYIANNF